MKAKPKFLRLLPEKSEVVYHGPEEHAAQFEKLAHHFLYHDWNTLQYKAEAQPLIASRRETLVQYDDLMFCHPRHYQHNKVALDIIDVDAFLKKHADDAQGKKALDNIAELCRESSALCKGDLPYVRFHDSVAQRLAHSFIAIENDQGIYPPILEHEMRRHSTVVDKQKEILSSNPVAQVLMNLVKAHVCGMQHKHVKELLRKGLSHYELMHASGQAIEHALCNYNHESGIIVPYLQKSIQLGLKDALHVNYKQNHDFKKYCSESAKQSNYRDKTNEDEMFYEEMNDMINNTLDKMDPKSAIVLILRNGLRDQCAMSQRKIGELTGYGTKQNVSLIEIAAKRHFREQWIQMYPTVPLPEFITAERSATIKTARRRQSTEEQREELGRLKNHLQSFFTNEDGRPLSVGRIAKLAEINNSAPIHALFTDKNETVCDEALAEKLCKVLEKLGKSDEEINEFSDTISALYLLKKDMGGYVQRTFTYDILTKRLAGERENTDISR